MLNEIEKTWDYDESVKKMKVVIYKWIQLTNEILHELYTARENLRSQGKRTDITSGNNTRSWESYCNDIGIVKRTANKWLEGYNPEIYEILKRDNVDINNLPPGVAKGFLIQETGEPGFCEWFNPAWRCYYGFLVDVCGAIRDKNTTRYVEWVAARFDNPQEWYGEEGDKWRAIWRMKKMYKKDKTGFEKYYKENIGRFEKEYQEDFERYQTE